MNRDAIIVNLESIWAALVQGDETEINIAGPLFFAVRNLKQYWYNMPYKIGYAEQPQIDPIENFLSNINEW